MIDKVRKWIEQGKLIETGDHIMIGVSGGADSVCLLLLLLELQKSMNFSLEVIHVEHGIRGAESLSDAGFVEKLCELRKAACRTYHVNVPEYAAENSIGMEEAARELRYSCYRRAAEQTGREQVKIALAHHADDNAETVLFQLVRGSGLKGMCGMRPKRVLTEQITIIRPMLGVTREEIEQYLWAQKQEFCMDSTNLDVDYSRNRIRHAVLPELKKINVKAASHIAQSAGMLAELSDYLADEVERIVSELCERRGERICVKMDLFRCCPAILQKEVVHRVLGEVASSRKDISSQHVESVTALAKLQVGRRISLPYQMVAERTYDGIAVWREAIEKERKTETCELDREQLARAEREEGLSIPLHDGELRIRVLEFDGKMREIQKKTYTKWLNYDKIKGSLQIRMRAGGDYLIIDEAGHRKKLKEYFIEEKIPRESRDNMWLLTDGSHVLWVVGGRISADYKVDANTKKILEVQMIGGNYHEDQKD